MDYFAKIQWLTQIEKRKWALMVGLVALTHLFCQSLMLPYGNALLSLLPDEKSNSLPMASSSSVEASIDDVSNPGSESLLVRKVKSTKAYNVGLDGGGDDGSAGKKGEEKVDFGLDGNGADDRELHAPLFPPRLRLLRLQILQGQPWILRPIPPIPASRFSGSRCRHSLGRIFL